MVMCQMQNWQDKLYLTALVSPSFKNQNQIHYQMLKKLDTLQEAALAHS